MKRPHAHLTVNLGQTPFVFDVDRMVAVSNSFVLRNADSR